MVSFFSPARVAFRVPSRIAHISSVNGIYGQRYPYRTVSPETSDSLNGTLSACHTTYISRRVRVSRRAEMCERFDTVERVGGCELRPDAMSAGPRSSSSPASGIGHRIQNRCAMEPYDNANGNVAWAVVSVRCARRSNCSGGHDATAG